MTSFSTSEIEAVVSQLTHSTIRRNYNALGTRDVVTSWGDVKEAIANIFLLYTRTPFYMAYLFKNKLLGDVNVLAETCSQLLQNLRVLRRRMLPVKDISSLENAQAALQELEGVIGNAPKDITVIPAYIRYNKNLERFLSRVGNNVKSQGSIVPTPNEARGNIPDLVTSLQSQMANLNQQLDWLRGAIEDYNSVNLPKLVVGTVIKSARKMLDARTDMLSKLSEQDRLNVLKETVLEVLAMKSVVRDFGRFLGTTTNQSLSGTVTAFADTTRVSTPASVVATILGPYNLFSAPLEEQATNVNWLVVDELEPVRFTGAVTGANTGTGYTTFTRASGSFLTDGVVAGDLVFIQTGASANSIRRVETVSALVLTCNGPDLLTIGACSILILAQPLTLYLPPSTVAKCEGLMEGPFSITSGVNDQMVFSIDGGADITVNFTAGSQSAQAIASTLSLALGAQGYNGEAYYSPLKFDGQVNTAGNQVTLPYGNFPGLIEIGNDIVFYSGPNFGTTRTITGLLPSPSSFNVITFSGAPLVTTTLDRIQVGSTKRVRIVPVNPYIASLTYSTLKIKAPTAVERNTGITLGIYGEPLYESRPTDAAEIASYVNGLTSAVSASTVLVPYFSNIGIRTDVATSNKLMVYSAYGVGSWGSGLSITITIVSFTTSAVAPVIGDSIILRGGNNVNAVGTITAISSTTINATFLTSITASSGALLEIVPAALVIDRGDVLVISEGPNTGKYFVYRVGTIPGECIVRVQPGVTKEGVEPVHMTGSIGEEKVTFASKDLTINSRIMLFDPNNLYISTDISTNNNGVTRYLQLPAPVPQEVSVDDIFEVYITTVETPDVSSVIQEVFADGVILISDDVSTTQTFTIHGSQVLPVPSALIKESKSYNFDTFKALLTNWPLGTPFNNLTSFNNELNRVINPLLKNQNPTDVDCGTAENLIKNVYEVLTEAAAISVNSPISDTLENIFSTYSVDSVIDIDAVLKSLQERGANRALDTLIACRFSSFFGMDQEETTVGGYFQKTLREVSVNDLPINKERRLASSTSPMIASVETTDYEYDLSDLDTAPQVDPPTYNKDF